MKFEEALMHLRLGKKIRQSGWTNNHFCKLNERNEIVNRFNETFETIRVEDVLSDDWEITEEPRETKKKLYAFACKRNEVRFFTAQGKIFIEQNPHEYPFAVRASQFDMEIK